MSVAVAITGMGAVTPQGVGVQALGAGWIAGRVELYDGWGSCRAFEPAAFLSRKEQRRADRYGQLAVVAADEAIADAGLAEDLPTISGRVGVVFGTQCGGHAALEEAMRVVYTASAGVPSSLTTTAVMPNAAGALVAMRHGITGPVFAVSAACASGAKAIAIATALIRGGLAEAMVVGGSEALLTEGAKAIFRSSGAISPCGRSLPFDSRRDGFVPSEGAGVLVLESEELAARRGARVLGRVRGVGMGNDAYHLSAPRPDGTGAAEAIRLALADAGVAAQDIDYVNAHGTGTPLNDRAEVGALKLALGESARSAPISSLKSSIGHSIGAAGVIETVATLWALNRRVIPPTLSLDEPDPELDLDFVPDGPRALDVADGHAPIALKNAFGFGGHNVALCLEGAAAMHSG